MDRVRIGVIGLGIMGHQYVEICSTHPFSRVVAVSDLRQDRLDEICQRHGIAQGYTEHREMLDRPDLDGIIVATPDAAHFHPVKDALESGRPVHCEKPFTTDVAEADELMGIEKRTGKRIQVSYNNRWLAPNHEIRVAIARGDIGKPLAGYARRHNQISMPIQALSWAGSSTSAWFLSSHDIDLVRWFINDEPVEARAWGRKEVLAARGIPTYDTIQAQVRFASGAFVTFESGWVYPNTYPSIADSFLEIVGTDGVIHLDRKREGMEIATHEKFCYPKSFVRCEISGRPRGAFPFCVEDFIAMVQNNTEPRVTSFDGRQVTATLSAIHKSLETDRTEKIFPPPAETKGAHAGS
jgi:predicted dehydrogenase